MSTDELHEAVSKRAWTQGPFEVYCGIRGNWYARNTETGRSVPFDFEAEARLFAAADAMYDVIKAHEAWEARLIHTSLLGRISNDMMDELIHLQKLRHAALRAANPDAFQEGDND